MSLFCASSFETQTAGYDLKLPVIELWPAFDQAARLRLVRALRCETVLLRMATYERPLPPASNRTLFRDRQGSERAQHAVSRRGLLSGEQHVPSHRRSIGEALADALPLYDRPSDGSAAAEPSDGLS